MNAIISAEVRFINNTHYIRAYSLTKMGLSDAAGNPIHIITCEKRDQLGPEILKTLKACKMGVPHPDFSLKQPKNEMVVVTGMKTEKELNKKGKKVSVYLEANQLQISLWVFDGKYMTGSPDLPDMYCSLDPDDITKTIISAFDKIQAYQNGR